VIGVPDERWGSRVAAIVQPAKFGPRTALAASAEPADPAAADPSEAAGPAEPATPTEPAAEH